MKKTILLISFTILVLFLTSLFSGTLVNDKSHALTKEQWLQDLDFVVQTLKNRHPNLYYRVSESEFQKAVEATKEKIRTAESYEASAVAIMQLVSFIEDGHTSLSLNRCKQLSRYFPIRFYKFSDGMFITVAGREMQIISAQKSSKLEMWQPSRRLKCVCPWYLPTINFDRHILHLLFYPMAAHYMDWAFWILPGH